MDDQAQAEAAKAGTGAAANAATTAGTAAATAPEWANGLQDAGNREYIGSKGLKDLDAVVTSARHGDKVQSELADLKTKALTLPAADAKAEDWDAFYGKLGRPEKAEGYEFKLPESLPKELPYDSERAAAFKAVSHKAGLTPAQAQIIHDWAATDAAAQYSAFNETNATTEAATQAEIAAAHAELSKVWGEKGSESYTENLQFADRYIKNKGGEDLLNKMKAKGMLAPDGAVIIPAIAEAVAAYGKTLFREGGGDLVTGNGGPGGPNPFDPKSPNITEQMRMYKTNPQQALAYIRAAGKQPSDFGLT